MKKALTCFAACLLCAALCGEAGEKEKLIKLSSVEWDTVKKCVDTNGYCRIVGQGAAIVITNGLPSVEVIHWTPIGRGPARRKLENEFHRHEPLPYVGQGGWR